MSKSLALVALVQVVGCSSLAPVARDPWLEDRSLELTAERLVLEVRPDVVDVDARFVFTPRSARRPHAMSFAIAEPGGARAFVAELVAPDGEVTRLRSHVGTALGLPIDGVGERREFLTPADAFARPGAWLRVRYSQLAERTFDYVLRTGAYWAGPIRLLEVVLRDPARRVVTATVESREPDRREGDELSWRFVELEPRKAIQVSLR